MKVDYHPAIENELREIRDFYESRSSGLGGEFVEAFDRQVQLIATMPERWLVVSGDTRRALMRRFPYLRHLLPHRPCRHPEAEFPRIGIASRTGMAQNRGHASPHCSPVPVAACVRQSDQSW